MPCTLTFDVFSALIDSRTGGSAYFAALARARSWRVTGTQIYDRWDSTNKALHRDCGSWVPFRELAERALASTYRELGLDGDVGGDGAGLLASMADWPLWPDVTADALLRLGAGELGLLSNIDDAPLAATAVMRLGVFTRVFTSERARAYKPSPDFYHRARRELGPYVHVASSARDVRGAIEAGVPCVRLVRPGHVVDPDGPQPRFVAESVDELADAVRRLAARSE